MCQEIVCPLIGAWHLQFDVRGEVHLPGSANAETFLHTILAAENDISKFE